MKHLICILTAVILVWGLPACKSIEDNDNNDRPIEDLVNYILTNTNAAPCCDMEPGPVHADKGFSVMISGRQVAFYKYDIRHKRQKKKLDYIKEHKYVYIMGEKYTAMVNGSFIMIDHDTNKQRAILEKVFAEF